MDPQSSPRKTAPLVLAFVLWLLTFGLGMEAVYTSKELFYLIFVQLGGGIETAERLVLLVVFVLGAVFMVFVISMTEYHRKWAGQPKSWRLFGVSLAVELSILSLYYLL
jgi:hypothetical protein